MAEGKDKPPDENDLCLDHMDPIDDHNLEYQNRIPEKSLLTYLMFKINVKSKEDYNHRCFPEIVMANYVPKFTVKQKSLNVFNNARDKALKTFFDEIGPTEKVTYQNDFVNPWIETHIDRAEKKKKRKTAMELL